MNSLDAVRLMVQNYPGGIDAVALRLGKSTATLYKELRGATAFKLGLQDAEAISEMCHELHRPHHGDLVNVLAERIGAVVMLMPELPEGAEDGLHDMAALLRETAEVVRLTTQAWQDNRITLSELKRLEKESAELIAIAQRLVQHARAAFEAEPVARLKGVA